MTAPVAIRQRDIDRIAALAAALVRNGLPVRRVAYIAPDGGKVEVETQEIADEWSGDDFKVG